MLLIVIVVIFIKIHLHQYVEVVDLQNLNEVINLKF